MTKISGPTLVRQTTIEFEQKTVVTNQSRMDILLANLKPYLFAADQVIQMYKLNPEMLVPILKNIGDICYKSKLGEVIIEIRPDEKGKAKIKRIRSVDTFHMDINAINE